MASEWIDQNGPFVGCVVSRGDGKERFIHLESGGMSLPSHRESSPFLLALQPNPSLPYEENRPIIREQEVIKIQFLESETNVQILDVRFAYFPVRGCQTYVVL